MNGAKKRKANPYDLTYEYKNERGKERPIRNKKRVDPYSLSRKTERRLGSNSGKKKRR